MKIAAVIVPITEKELLKQCIEQVLQQENADCDILVIDNHSTDGTGETLQPFLDAGRIDYYDTGSNLGRRRRLLLRHPQGGGKGL